MSSRLYMYSCALEKTDLAFCTSYVRRPDKYQQRTTSSIKNISKLEGIAPKGCRTTSGKYPQRQNFANVVKKKPLLDLQRLQRNHPSVVLLQTRLCSRGRTCLLAETCLVSPASL